MIFDILILMCTGLLFSISGVCSFILGAKYQSERQELSAPKKECEGWDGIINFDHSKKGGER